MMNEMITLNNSIMDRTPSLIASEINTIKDQTRKMVLYNSIEIGRRLVEAKQLIEHGEWGAWLEQYVNYSKSTANNLMRIFEEYGSEQITLFGDNAKSQALGNLSYTQAVALLGIPEEERESFIENNDIENMSTRELQQAIKEREQALKEKDIALQDLEEAKKAVIEKDENIEILQKELRKERDYVKTEFTRLNDSLTETRKKLAEAEETGDTEEAARLEEALEETNISLKEAEAKIAQLERELKEKPIEVEASTIIEKVPEEIERELQELRTLKEKASQIENRDNSTVKFAIYFDELVNNFKVLLGTLAEIQGEDHEKYKNAILKTINSMAERLQ